MLAPAIREVQKPAWPHRVCLPATQKHLQAGGIEVSRMIGDPDPMTALEREWQRVNGG
jgi:hypothetical protein